MKTIAFYFVNVLVISVPIALFEIYLERFKSGWGGEFTNQFWGKRFHFKFLDLIAEKTYLSTYHIIMWLVAMPLIYLGIYLLMHHLSKNRGWMVLEFHNMGIIPVLYLPALALGVAIFEDFLWAALNWHYEHALIRFFKAGLEWHTHWVRIASDIMIPRFYIWVAIVVALLLLTQRLLLVRLSRG
jgi:hypothetical protein